MQRKVSFLENCGQNYRKKGEEKMIENFKKVMQSKANQIIFIITIIISGFSHYYLFTNQIMNGDYLGDSQYDYSQVIIGRFMPQLFPRLAPPVLFLITVVLFAIAVYLVVDMFKIESYISIILVATIMSAFPALAYSMVYVIAIERYMMALTFSIMAIWINLKNIKFSFVLGAIFLAAALGEYQSYLGVSIVLSIIYLLYMLLEDIELKDVLKKAYKFMGTGILGVAFYFVILKIFLFVEKTQLSNYKGANEVGKIKLNQIPFLLKKVIYHFYQFFTGKNYFSVGIAETIYWIVLAIVICLVLVFVFKRDLWRGVIAVFLVCMLPIGVNIIDIAVPQTEINAMQIYQLCLLILLPVLLLEKIKNHLTGKWIKIVSILILTTAGILAFKYFEYTSVYYHRAVYYSDQTVNLVNRVWARIEQEEAYAKNKNIPMLFLVDMKPLYEKDGKILREYIKCDVGYYDRFINFNNLDSVLGSNKIAGIIWNKLGIGILPATYEQMEKVINNEEYFKMGVWPEKSSIRVIDNVMVINMAATIGLKVKEQENKIIVEAKTSISNANYAFYIYNEHEIIFTRWYEKNNQLEFDKALLENASYYMIEVFCVDDDGNNIGHRISNRLMLNQNVK